MARKKNHFIRNLLIVVAIAALVVSAITYFQEKKGTEVTLKDQISKTVGSVKDSVMDSVVEAIDSIDVDELLDDLTTDSSSGSESYTKPGNAGTSSNKNVSECDLGYPENNPLMFGNPTDAYHTIDYDDNYLMEKENYTLSYNNNTLCANWAAWHLDENDIGSAKRSNKFVADDELPSVWHHVTKEDYQFSDYGFDRGHLCPSADRTYSEDANKETFLMTNMVPQSSDNNRIVWVALEKFQRELIDEGNELYIFAGPAGTGGEGEHGYFDFIPVVADDGTKLKINVPAYTWKIIVAIPDGEDDLSRIDENSMVFSVCVPNKKGINSDDSWRKYLCSVDDIEKLTGYDFLEILEDDIEDSIEERVVSARELGF